MLGNRIRELLVEENIPYPVLDELIPAGHNSEPQLFERKLDKLLIQVYDF